MNGDRIGDLLSMAVEDMIEDARYAANLGGLEGARRMMSAYEACRGLDPLDLEVRSSEAPTMAGRLAAAWCVEVWKGLSHLIYDASASDVSPGALHKAAELLGYVAPGVRTFSEPV